MVNYTKQEVELWQNLKIYKDSYEMKKYISKRSILSNWNISRAVAMYETGRRSPDKDTLNKLGNYFNVSVDYFLGRTKEKITVNTIKSKLASDSEFKLLLNDFFYEKIYNSYTSLLKIYHQMML
ncbi:MAG: helix-turn-helix domain-containing protein [Halanaerobiales bacterium]